MPVKTITAEIDGKTQKITADIPEGATHDQLIQAVQDWHKSQGQGGGVAPPKPEMDLRNPESPSSRFVSGAARNLNPMPALRLAGDVLSTVRHPSAENIRQTGSELYQGFVKPQLDEFGKAMEDLKRGDPLTAAAHAVYGIIPGVGPAMSRGAERIGSGDVAGGLGEWSGALAPMVLGASPKTAATAARAGARSMWPDLAESYYKGAIKPADSMPLPWQEAMVKEGLAGEILPNKAGMEKASARAVTSASRVDALTSPGSATGSRSIPMADILRPIEQEIGVRGRSNDPSTANALIELRDDFVSRHPGGAITVSEAQELKRNTDKVLNPSVHKADAHPGPDPLGMKLLRQGEREGIEQAIPGIKEMNQKTKSNVELSKSIEAQLRKHPTFMHAYTPWIVGTATGALAGRLIGGDLHGAAAGAGSAMAALVAKEAMHSPQVLARLAIALNKEGITLPISKAGAVYSGATLGPSQSIPKSPPPPGSTDDQYRNPYE